MSFLKSLALRFFKWFRAKHKSYGYIQLTLAYLICVPYVVLFFMVKDKFTYTAFTILIPVAVLLFDPKDAIPKKPGKDQRSSFDQSSSSNATWSTTDPTHPTSVTNSFNTTNSNSSWN